MPKSEESVAWNADHQRDAREHLEPKELISETEMKISLEYRGLCQEALWSGTENEN